MPDPNDLAKQDAQKAREAYQNYKQNDGVLPKPAKILENFLWAMSVLCVVFIIVALPFVGDDKLISGTQWMGLGSAGIILFALAAYIVRVIAASFNEVDQGASRAFERGR